MASQLIASPASTGSSPTNAERFVKLLVHRRVPISALLFAGLVTLDLVVIRSRPRDVLNLMDPLVAVSLFLIALGLAVRSWAAGTLRKQRELATTGPYAWVRHPLYFGSFLMMVGFGTLVHDPITLWVVAGPVAWIYWHAIQSEERKISVLFPAEWPAYARRVPRLLPHRIAKPHLGAWSLAQWLRNSEYQAVLGSAVAVIGIKLWQLWI